MQKQHGFVPVQAPASLPGLPGEAAVKAVRGIPPQTLFVSVREGKWKGKRKKTFSFVF